MTIPELATLITAVGSLVGAIGAVYNGKRINVVKKEVLPNHGTSLNDAVNRIEVRQAGLIATTDSLAKDVGSLGHQIGEIRQTDNVIHADLAARLRALENK